MATAPRLSWELTSGRAGENCSLKEVATTDSLRGCGQGRETTLTSKGPDPLEQRGQGARGNDRVKRNNFGKGAVYLAFFVVFDTGVEVSDLLRSGSAPQGFLSVENVWFLIPCYLGLKTFWSLSNSFSLEIKNEKGWSSTIFSVSAALS